jgi:hypothetical protein
MTIDQFKKLSRGDLVWYVANSGAAGISQYQYIGVHQSHIDGRLYHVFLSPYFVSTVVLSYRELYRSRHIKNLFLTEQDAKDRAKEPDFEY